MLFVERFWKNLARGGASDVDIITEFHEHIVRFPCHKRILCKASEFFKKEFSRSKRCLLLKNVEPNIIFLLLSYIYDGKIEPTDWKTTADLLIAAISYKIPFLYEYCVRSLLDHLNLSNACSLLELSMVYSIPALYSLSLKLCINGAFYILDTEDFNWIRPSTIIFIVSQPLLNIPNETYVLYSLWIRATIDNCRNNRELTYENIARNFEPYSTLIEYKDVSEDELRLYKNDYLLQYFRDLVIKQERIYPSKRFMKFPLQLPKNLFVHYNTGEIISVGNLEGTYNVEFSMKESVYLLEFSIVCIYISNESESGIDSVWIENDKNCLFRWNNTETNLKLKLKLHKKTAYMSDGRLHFQVFQFILQDLVKLDYSTTYYLRIKTSNTDLPWPEFKSKSTSNCLFETHSITHKCLRNMTFLPCPSVICSE
ncbi:kelch-like protein 40a [Nephila pilipes]|uniref:Kelch-like protein 40a n=1 Tax=Nephila pilipes TaxID=299642 RepID=A0A8X6PLJ2_NEPPI|nr:kelch-like protein 40a [Nephila pilipes]